jgi:gliding motility-associated protein GldM
MKQSFLFSSILIILSTCISCDQIIQQSSGSGSSSSSNSLASIKQLKNNNTYIENSNEVLVATMEATTETKVQYQPLIPIAKEIQSLTTQFHQYTAELKDLMVEESNGAYTDAEAEAEGNTDLIGMPKNGTNKKAVKQIFISGQYSGSQQEAQGAVLDSKLNQLKRAYLETIADMWDNGGIRGTVFADPSKKAPYMAKLSSKISMPNEEKKSRETTWVEESFKGKTVQETYLLLTQYENQVNLSTAFVLSFLSEQMGKLELAYDKFDVFVQSPKPYILLGEKYESEIALGAYSSQAKFSVSVGGSSLSVVDGKAKYSATGSSVGEKKYTATITVVNPQTGERETFKKDFSYEVGQPSVNVAADKQNVLYIGVDNPVTVAAAGITTSSLKVTMSGGSLKSYGKTSYLATVTRPGEAIITVIDTKNGKKFPFKFRVKRIPNPTVKLGKNMDGLMNATEFKSQPGLVLWLEDFDYDARCNVESYDLTYTRKRQDAVELKAKGGRFSGKALQAVQQAKPGDQYSFTNVKARCPGDRTGRQVNGLAFRIK